MIAGFAAIRQPFTFAVIPFKQFSRDAAAKGLASGHQVILHLPMEPMSGVVETEVPITVRVGMSQDQIRELIDRATDSLPGIIGVNNHQGSKATADRNTMDAVMKKLRQKGLFFVDSRTNPYDIRWARQLSEIWENEITEGRGFAYNCNAVKFKYKHCGIGMVDHCNEEAMKGLMRIAAYLTKPDEWMRIRLDNNERSFGKGTIKPTTQKKRGRVRQKPSAKIWNI